MSWAVREFLRCREASLGFGCVFTFFSGGIARKKKSARASNNRSIHCPYCAVICSPKPFSRGRPSTRCKWFASAFCKGRGVTLHISQFGSFEQREMTWCCPIQREIAGSLSHGVHFTFVFVPTSSSRIGSGASAFLSAIEVVSPIRSLSQRAGLLWCAVAFIPLGVNDVQINGRCTEYRRCVVQIGRVSGA